MGGDGGGGGGDGGDSHTVRKECGVHERTGVRGKFHRCMSSVAVLNPFQGHQALQARTYPAAALAGTGRAKSKDSRSRGFILAEGLAPMSKGVAGDPGE